MSPKLQACARTARLLAASCAAVMVWTMAMGLAPARADGVFAGGCVHGSGFSCAGFWRNRIVSPYVIHVPPPRSELEEEEAAERDRRWEAHCRPTVKQDRYGVGRYQYEAPGCEYGKYE